MHFIVYCLFAGCLVYSLIILVLHRALGRVCRNGSGEAPTVSVVLAARNEERTIGDCLDSLRNQQYPSDRFEVIVADDRSADQTSRILEDYCREWPSLRCIHINSTPEGISPKKNALGKAISLARSDIILQTDADCIVPPDWIRGMAGRFEPEVGFVAGVAPYRKASGVLNSFIRHEYLWNAALSAASIAMGRGTHASARNMGFRRQIFEQIQGYGDSGKIISGDDTLLLQRICRFKAARAVTMPDPKTHVYTTAPNDIAAFVRQRIRHFSTGRFFAPVQILAGGAVYGFHGLLLGLLVVSVFIPELRLPALSAFGWKAAADALMAGRVQAVLGLEVDWRRFLPNEFLLLIYMTAFPLAGACIPVTWKQTPRITERST